MRRDGTFVAKGTLPPTALRHGNRARYQAKIGRERSLRLKLLRRMLVTRLSSRKGKVTIKGRVVLPLGRPIQRITIKRRVSCTKNVVVKSLRPDSRGPILDHARRPAERAGRRLPAGDQGAQEQAQPQAVSHLHAAARGGAEPVGDAPGSIQAAGVPPESDPLPVAALAACGSS